MIIHMIETTNRRVEISKDDIVDLMRVHQCPDREDGQDIGEWLFENATGDVLTVLIGLSDVEDQDVEFDEIEIDEDEEDPEDDRTELSVEELLLPVSDWR